MGLFSKKTKDEAKDVKPKAAKTAKTDAAPKAKVAKTKAVKAPKEKVAKTPAVVADAQVSSNPAVNYSKVILRPRVTEKSSYKADAENVFVFEIAHDANKVSVREAIFSMFKVRPVKVSIARTPSKNVFYRGRSGVSSGIKKAYVYLKEGDKIEIV